MTYPAMSSDPGHPRGEGPLGQPSPALTAAMFLGASALAYVLLKAHWQI